MGSARTWLLCGCLLALGCGETSDSKGGSGGSAGQAAGGSSANAGQATGGSSAAGTTAGGSSSSAGEAGAASGGDAAGTASAGAAQGGAAAGGAAQGGSSSAGANGLVDCDPQKVLCKIVQPECPQGEVPSVNGSCYGACVKIDRCSCTSAAQCPQPDQFTCLKGPMHCSYYLK